MLPYVPMWSILCRIFSETNETKFMMLRRWCTIEYNKVYIWITRPSFTRPDPYPFICIFLKWWECWHFLSVVPLQTRHNGCDGVSQHQPHDCLLKRLFRRRSIRNQSSASLAFVRGIHRWPVNSPHKGPVTWKMFPYDHVIMNAGNEALLDMVK